MSDGKITFNISDELLQFGKNIEDLEPKFEDAINQVVRDVAINTYNQIIAKAQSNLSSTRQDYLKALSFQPVGNNEWVIELDGAWANKLEDGFPPYAMKDIILNSTKKVSNPASSRYGEPWVRIAKDGTKYGAIPFEHSRMKVDMKLPDLTVLNPMTQKKQKINRLFKDLTGAVIQGKVGSFKLPQESPSEMQNLTKYQYTDPKSGRTNSVYMTFRMISEKSQGFQHPGYEGLGAFAEAEQKVSAQIDAMLRDIFKD